MVRDPHVLAPRQAPTPFTAAEIRGRCAVGKTIRVLVEIDGEQPFERLTTYVECDDAGRFLTRTGGKVGMTVTVVESTVP